MKNKATMSPEQFEREINYGIHMAAARFMLASEIISAADYRKIDTIMQAEYRPIIGGLPKNISR